MSSEPSRRRSLPRAAKSKVFAEETKVPQVISRMPKVRNPNVIPSSQLKPVKRRPKASKSSTTLLDLNQDVLESIVHHLDTSSALNFVVTCKQIHRRLTSCSGYWHKMCRKEHFHEYTALKSNDSEDEQDDGEVEQPRKRRKHWIDQPENTKEIRTAYNGEKLHTIHLPPDAGHWQKVFLRGLQMRRNVCQGRFEMWRLYLTDHDHLPVKKLTKDTTWRELRSSHRSSKYNTVDRRVRIHRYWTEEYMIAIQYRKQKEINDLFVWEWHECQNPKFRYVFPMYDLYPEGVSPMAFFLWKKYIVLMPNEGHERNSSLLRALIRVHDLSDTMRLVGSYDLPENGRKRRMNQALNNEYSYEAAHLHKMGDYAVGLVRVPEFYVYMFSLPDCRLVRETRLEFGIEKPLELDDLEQKFMAKKGVMYFMFNDPNFVNNASDNDACLSRLVMLDFTDFLRESRSEKSAEIHMRIDEWFDSGVDYIEKVSLVNSRKLACILHSGRLVIKEVEDCLSKAFFRTSNVANVKCPERLMDEMNRFFAYENVEEPTMVVSRDGDVVIVMQHYSTGRKIHAYETSKGRLLYTIHLDNQLKFQLNGQANVLSIDMDGNFICVADLDQIVIWNARNGHFVRTIAIPAHYRVRDDEGDSFAWRGHTDFAFAEDGLVVVHGHRNFPIAADILLFW